MGIISFIFIVPQIPVNPEWQFEIFSEISRNFFFDNFNNSVRCLIKKRISGMIKDVIQCGEFFFIKDFGTCPGRGRKSSPLPAGPWGRAPLGVLLTGLAMKSS